METVYENQQVLLTNQRELAAQQAEMAREIRSNTFNSQPAQNIQPIKVKPIEKTIQPLQLVRTNHSVKHDKLDLFCMAKNIYHEAANEPIIGRYAVAQITLNRKMNPRYPKKICEVILDPYQFSWANDKRIRWTQPKGPAWEEAKKIAEDVVIHGYRVKGLENGLFYHADYVSPKWKDRSATITQVGRHIFYSRAL